MQTILLVITGTIVTLWGAVVTLSPHMPVAIEVTKNCLQLIVASLQVIQVLKKPNGTAKDANSLEGGKLAEVTSDLRQIPTHGHQYNRTLLVSGAAAIPLGLMIIGIAVHQSGSQRELAEEEKEKIIKQWVESRPRDEYPEIDTWAILNPQLHHHHHHDGHNSYEGPYAPSPELSPKLNQLNELKEWLHKAGKRDLELEVDKLIAEQRKAIDNSQRDKETLWRNIPSSDYFKSPPQGAPPAPPLPP